MKHYIDIDNLRDSDVLLNGMVTRPRNDLGFCVGDRISITEKWDGSNASATFEDGIVKAFSRRQELSSANTLNGFYTYIQTMNPTVFVDHPEFILFGEWGTKNKIVYNADAMNKWYIYDVWDKTTETWLHPYIVKDICEQFGLEYIHELYNGPFISWDHCRTFMHSPHYGDRQEGIVVRNLDKYNSKNERVPFILKLVNDDFKESMANKIKVVDPEKEAARSEATEALQAIVTQNRVEKCLHKLQEDQIVPVQLNASLMGAIAKVLPKAVYEDCVKEEPEIMAAYAEYAGKLCGSMTMAIARKLILG